ncbi:MAG: SgcJ/EcaC family oxidoreductase [Lysobacteraceae bacterium]
MLNLTRRTLVTSFALLLGLSTSAMAREYRGEAPLPVDADEREIAALFDRWNAALATGNPQQVAALYAADGVLQPTVSNWMRVGQDEIANYFESFLKKQPQGVINSREIKLLDDDSALDAGIYTFTLHDGQGGSQQVQARYTYVYEKQDGEWKISLHHSSAMPEPVASLAMTD